MSSYYVHYVSGIHREPVPKPTKLSLERDGLKLFKQTINWQQINDVRTSNGVGSGFSVGGAIVGDALAGGLGALVGGMSGGAKVTVFVHIRYVKDGTTNELVFQPKGPTKQQTQLVNSIMEHYGKEPTPQLSFREQLRADKQKRDAELEARWGPRREQIAAMKQKRAKRQKERPQWLQESPLNLLRKLRKK